MTIDHSPTEWTICRITAAYPHRTNHVCRLCCSRALWTEKQRACLVSASEARCSAVQSMAPVRVLPPQNQPKQQNNDNKKSRQTERQTANKKTNQQQKKGGISREKKGVSWQRQKDSQNKFSKRDSGPQ